MMLLVARRLKLYVRYPRRHGLTTTSAAFRDLTPLERLRAKPIHIDDDDENEEEDQQFLETGDIDPRYRLGEYLLSVEPSMSSLVCFKHMMNSLIPVFLSLHQERFS